MYTWIKVILLKLHAFHTKIKLKVLRLTSKILHTINIIKVSAGFFHVITLCTPLAVPPIGLTFFSEGKESVHLSKPMTISL